jgi:hypothetical protein
MAAQPLAGVAAASRFIVWEEVLGAFQVSIPISTRTALFEPETRLLSVLRWILGGVPKSDRWYRPFERYVAEIGGRVHGFGGDPTNVVADPNGLPDRPGPGTGIEPGEGLGGSQTGKIASLVYDRWGDFEGFILDTATGEHRYSSREHTIEELATRSWRERTVITVVARVGDRHAPEKIVLRYGPRPHWG